MIKLKDKTFRISIPYEDISNAIDKVAEKINADFRGCEDIPILLCVLNGSIMFMGELMKRLDFNCQLVSTKLTLYLQARLLCKAQGGAVSRNGHEEGRIDFLLLWLPL